VRVLPQQVRRRHDHLGRAVAALEGVLGVESLLQRVQAAIGHALDRGDLGAIGLHGPHSHEFPASGPFSQVVVR